MTRGFACSLAVLAASLLLIGGCGGDSDTDRFKKEYKAQREDLRAISNGITAAIRGASRQTNLRLAGQFNSLGKRTQSLRTRLRGLEPPSQVESDYENLAASLARGEADLKRLELALRASDPRAARFGAEAMGTDWIAITRYADAIVSKLKIK